MGPVRALAAASLAAGLLLAAGCTSGSEPAPSTTPNGSSTTAGPPPTPSTTPRVPAAARAHTEAGAEAFVRFYMDQVNVAWTTPDPDVLPPLSEDHCLSCAAFQETTTGLVANRHRYASQPVSVGEVKAIDGGPSGQQHVRMLLHQHESQVVDASNKVVLTDKKKDATLTVSLLWEGAGWLLYDMG